MKTIQLFLFLIGTSILSAQSLSPWEDLPFNDLTEKFEVLNPSSHSTSSNFIGNPVKKLDSLINTYVGGSTNSSGDTKVVYDYNTTFTTIGERRYLRLNSTSAWEINSYFVQNFDSNRKPLDYTYSAWSTTSSSFNNVNQGQYTYNTNDQLIELLILNYVDSLQTWVPHRREQRTYQANGEVEEILFQVYDSIQWVSVQRNDYTYNSSDLLVLLEVYTDDNGSLVINHKNDYSYNSNQEVSQILNSSMYSGTWEVTGRTDYTYFPTVQGYTSIQYLMYNNVLEPNFKSELVYDQFGNYESYRSWNWEPGAQTWNPSLQQLLTFDNNFAYAVLATSLQEDLCNHQILTFDEYYPDVSGQPYKLQYQGTFYWSNLSQTNNESVFIDQIQLVSPNPASDFLHFELPTALEPATVELFNVAGQRVANQQLNANNVLSIQDLPPGFYSYLVRQDEQLYSGKVIIQ